ncbi:LicD family protein [Streptococcus suis]|uniref:LicD family protein n=1 Tax=Streptococcus suis TaxID=1307 RepID=A0A1C9IG96_STRSU|nr:LicD family protein [Streptococcus suis]HEL1996355.1 LicD family protein [Streptococcus suis]HEM5093822.1 LicD family protein [Streptococcus suis]HEM5117502.1 LicD family protein [Streptococcus suis]HEP1805351.1 LicD family protein [Streptococcus suis]
MDGKKDVKEVQGKILEVMKYIDGLCRDNGIVYYIMGGTALGAVRHGGFIPWDDDLDIFMTPPEYEKFKKVFEEGNSSQFVLQEWRTTPDYLEYAKVRMNGTTFIEEAFKDRKDLHQGIYVDIMILHKVPEDKFIQKLVYYESKFVTLYALSQRNWKPKSTSQKLVLKSLKFMPCKLMAKCFYRRIYKYDDMKTNFKYCYWITPAKFRSGLFESCFFSDPVDIPFEDTVLLCSIKIKEYLEYRYGDYMKLPSKEAQHAAVHAMFFDINRDYKEYTK